MICAFDLIQINNLFENSDLMTMGASNSERRKWIRQSRVIIFNNYFIFDIIFI